MELMVGVNTTFNPVNFSVVEPVSQCNSDYYDDDGGVRGAGG